MPDLLKLEALRAGYGEAVVLPNLSLTLPEGQVLALLGRNGTGKTTLINSIVGITRRFGGSVALGGIDLTAMRPDQRARADAQSKGSAARRADRGAGADHRRGTAAGARRHHAGGRHLFYYRGAECTKDSEARRPRCDIGARCDRSRRGERGFEG